MIVGVERRTAYGEQHRGQGEPGWGGRGAEHAEAGGQQHQRRNENEATSPAFGHPGDAHAEDDHPSRVDAEESRQVGSLPVAGGVQWHEGVEQTLLHGRHREHGPTVVLRLGSTA
jgi:hypothetical protein